MESNPSPHAPNSLINERSPYLLQHAHNPVRWEAWSDAALARARAENKPILVSIGYSTCHWCHVMERESFENVDIAQIMNDKFVNIKIDREERPDLDQIYMEACQLITGSGGWPLNCFLLPDGRPFFAGTYYPPEPAYNRPSWRQVLVNLSNAFENRREVVEEQAQKLTDMIGKSDTKYAKNALDTGGGQFSTDFLEKMAREILHIADRNDGGFGRAPKFPHALTIQYLLHFYHTSQNSTLRQDALDQATLALDKMIFGGIYDQIGGGFSRYSVDNEWLVPHFEKMLYDNALLISALADAYKITKKELYRTTILETVNFVLWEMMSPQFGFYSAFDADSEGEEGKFYVWSKSEIEENLGVAAAIFCDFYGVTEDGNFEGHNILFRQQELKDFCEERNLDYKSTAQTFEQCREILLDLRDERVPPSLDDKILTSWNALFISALAHAHEALDTGGEAFSPIREELRDPLKIHDFKDVAILNIEFLLNRLTDSEGNLYHAAKGLEAYGTAFLEDYAFTIAALLDVYQISFDEKYLEIAQKMTDQTLRQFWDEADGLFFFTAAGQADLIARKKDLFDNATPSANATMLQNLQRLAIIFDEKNYAQKADIMLRNMEDSLRKYPVSFSRWALGALWQTEGATEIAIVGKSAENLATAMNQYFIPNKILLISKNNRENYELLKNRFVENKTMIYVCRDFSCQKPVETVEAALDLI